MRLWDLRATDVAASAVVLRGHEIWISAVAVSPDNRWLITGSGDGTARRWKLRLDELLALACYTSGRNFSYTEWDQYFRGEEYRIPCPDLPVHPSVIITARDLAKSGEINGAISIFQRAVELDSRVEFDPTTEAHKWAAKGLIEKGEQLALQGKIDEAIAVYKEA